MSETHDAKANKPVFHFQYFENKAANKKGAFAPNQPMFTFTLPQNGVMFGTFKAGRGAKGAKGAKGVNKPQLAAQGTSCAKFLLENRENQFIDEQASRAPKKSSYPFLATASPALRLAPLALALCLHAPARPRLFALQVSDGCGTARVRGVLPTNDGCLCFALVDSDGKDRVMRVLADGANVEALKLVKRALPPVKR